MGNPKIRGHILSGLLGGFIGIWWIYSALRRYFLVKYLQNSEYKYRNTVTYPVPCFSPRAPVEAWAKVFIFVTGAAAEYSLNEKVGWSFQHVLIHVFFLMSGITDLLVHYFPRVMPKHVDHMYLAFSLYMRYWILSNHKHGKGGLEIMVHSFLLPLDQAAIIATLLEVFCSESVVPALIRATAIFISGTWTAHLGFILFPISGIISYDENDHNDLGLISGLYTIHYIGAVMVLYAMMYFTECRVRKYVSRLGSHPDISLLDCLPNTDLVEYEPDLKAVKHP